MFGRSKKKDDYEDEEYEDEEYEEDEDYDDNEEYEDDDEYEDDEYDDDYDDEPRGNKGLVIGLIILSLLLAAIAGLLFMRLRSANAEVESLKTELNAVRTELNAALADRTTSQTAAPAAAAPETTPEPTTEPDMADATNGPEVETPDEPQPAEPDMVEDGGTAAGTEATPAPAEATPAPTPAGTPDSKYIGINTSTTINITTNPEAKTVKAGQSATFSAAAANWKWCAWRFISPDGLHEIIFDKVNTKFAGVTTNGGNGTTFTVNNIPKDMDGWKAVCLFVDAGNGMKVTEGGTITVTD